jgi:SAM-dependent methyltransferase
MSNENVNNPYHRTAASYEKKLNLPVVRTFRRAEERKLKSLFDAIIRSSDTVLEIGCGTGYYTRDLVKRAAKVIALDDSETMLELVRNRVSDDERTKMEFVRSEATQYAPDCPVDVVMHIGVLDYVKEWEKFLSHSLTHARRAVIFTCPTTGPWGQVFHILSRFEGVRIQRYHRMQIEQFLNAKFPGWACEMELVGFNSNWSGAMTWVVALTRAE